MAEQMDVRSALSFAPIYDSYQRLLGATRLRRALANDVIRAKSSDRVLDIGCGTGAILRFLSDCDYVGFDASERYISQAFRDFGSKGKFQCAQVDRFSLRDAGTFDIVLAMGILHHLSDSEATELFELAATALKPKGRLVTIDGVFHEQQSRMARWIISKDRGQYIRTESAYVHLAKNTFRAVKARVRDDLLLIPYSHLIMECSAESA